MGKMLPATTKTATVLTVGFLAFGAAACSSPDDTASDGTATSATTSQSGDAIQTGSAQAGSAQTDPVPAGSPAGQAPTVLLDGTAVEAEFQPVRCEWETDEGHPQLEYDAGSDSTGGDLEVEIVMSDPPKLDDFALETGGVEWEAEDADKAGAQITVNGDDYHVVSTVTEDDGTRTAELDAAFACAS